MNSLVISNALHRPARTLVSILGISIGVFLIVFTIGLANGSLREQARLEANVSAEIMFYPAGTVGIGGSEVFRLPVSLKKELEKVPGVKTAVAIGQTSVDAKDNNSGKRLVDGIIFSEYASLVRLNLVEGRMFSEEGDEAIIDTAWQAQKKLLPGDKIQIWERDFVVVGTYEPAAGARLKIPLATMQKQLGSEGKASSFLIKTADGFSDETVAASLHENFPDNQIILTKDLEELYLSSIPALGVFLNVVIGVAAVISAMVILLTMYTTVTERTRQIGVLKSLGMSNSRIAWTIAKEAILLSLCGIISGILLTVLLKYILSIVTSLKVELDPMVMFWTTIIGLIGGALGALYPAFRAARLDAVEALSYE